MTQLDPNYNADLLDAMADHAAELEEAMRESDQTEWSLIEHNGDFVGFTTTNSDEGLIHDDEDS